MSAARKIPKAEPGTSAYELDQLRDWLREQKRKHGGEVSKEIAVEFAARARNIFNKYPVQSL